jgi:hypothetical protein
MENKVSEKSREFMVFVRTQMFFRSRLKGIDKDLKVYISTKEIDSFFPYPRYDRNRELSSLVDAGELKIHEGTSTTTGNKVYYYEALKPGAMDIRYMKPNPPSNDPLIKTIKRHLKGVSLAPGSPSTPYFDAFLKFKDRFIDVFFSEDQFCGRIHTPVSNFHTEYRENILIDGRETVSFDVATMQPLLLGKILRDNVGDNEFSQWIDEGRDIYCELQKRAKLETRDQGKKRFFEILFSKPSDQLATMFGGSDWISWVNEYKARRIDGNPHNQLKPHSNLAWLLQTTEVKLMRKVWELLAKNNIPFLSVHDEIIVQRENGSRAETIFRNVLKKEFTTFKLNCSKQIDAPEPPPRVQEVGEIFDMLKKRGLKTAPRNCSINAGIWNSNN